MYNIFCDKGVKMIKKYNERLRIIFNKLLNERNKSSDIQSMIRYPHNDILNMIEGYLSGDFNSTWKKGNKTYTSTILVDERADGLTIKQTIARLEGGLRRKAINKELDFNKDGTIKFTRYIGNHNISDLVTKTISRKNEVITMPTSSISSVIRKNK